MLRPMKLLWRNVGLYAETNEAPLEERRLKLSMNYYLKTRACIENPARHALHEFDQTTRVL